MGTDRPGSFSAMAQPRRRPSRKVCFSCAVCSPQVAPQNIYEVVLDQPLRRVSLKGQTTFAGELRMIDQTRMSVSKLAMRTDAVVWSSRPPVPVDAHWNDVWLAVTPIWAVLATGRVVFYALERIRYPADVPPVIADAIQA